MNKEEQPIGNSDSKETWQNEDIPWIPVESSNINMVRYNHKTKGLEIWFHNGSIYGYTPVTNEGYQDFINAESLGKYFNNHIRNNENITTVQLHNKIMDGKIKII